MVALGGFGAASRRSFPAASASAWLWPAPWSTRPKVLLLDEPLGALDLKLREQMQVELKAIQRQVGITFIYVTHDQGEALVHERPRRRLQPGPDRAARPAPPELYEAPGDRLRRRVRRRFQPARIVAELAARPSREARRPARSGRRRSISRTPAPPFPPMAWVSRAASARSSLLAPIRATTWPWPSGGDAHGRCAEPRRPCRTASRATVRLWWEARHLLRFAPMEDPRADRGTTAAARAPNSLSNSFSTFLYRRPRAVLLTILLVPPLLWLGVIYLGSLFALLAQSFFSIDDFTARIGLRADARHLCAPVHHHQSQHHPAHRWLMAAVVTAHFRRSSPFRSPTTSPASPADA